jgi:hypothetical protein
VGVPRPVHQRSRCPRVRDFRGLGTKSFDGRGNYTLGIKEQMIFPEINYDMVEQIHGMDITFVTTTDKDDQSFALLHRARHAVPWRRQAGDVVAFTGLIALGRPMAKTSKIVKNEERKALVARHADEARAPSSRPSRTRRRRRRRRSAAA